MWIVKVLRRLPRCSLVCGCHIIDGRVVVRILEVQLGRSHLLEQHLLLPSPALIVNAIRYLVQERVVH